MVDSTSRYLKDMERLNDYSLERGCVFNVESLINSHRRLIEELNAGSRKDFTDNLEAARKAAYEAVLDERFIEISKLKSMSLSEIVGMWQLHED